jgi:hypothetical protein
MSRFRPIRTLTLLALSLTALLVGARPAAAATAVTQKPYLVISDTYYSTTARNRLSQLGITYGVTSFAGLATADPNQLVANYRAVYLPVILGGDQYAKLRALVVTGGVLERFANAGGTLVLNVCGNADSQPGIAPGGVNYDRTNTHNAEAITNPGHPYFTGAGYGGAVLNRGHFGAWVYTDYGNLTDLPTGAAVLLANEDGPSLAEYRWGRGRVIVSTLSYGWPGFPARTSVAWNNLLLYGASVKPIAGSSTPPPSSGSGSGSGPEKVAPKITFSSSWPNGQLVRGPNGRPGARIIVTDPLPSSGLAEIKVEGQNYNVVSVNGQPIAAVPVPYSITFAPGSNVTTWEIVVEKIYMQSLGVLQAVATDAAGNQGGAKR